MKPNICENLLRRSFENHLLTYRHNKQQDEMLEQKFSLYQRQMRFINNAIYMAENRFEQHAKNDLGFVVSYKRKPLEPSQNHQFYYTSTNKNGTIKEYSVEPIQSVRQHKNLYEHAFERRSRQYTEELKQKTHSQQLGKEHFMNETISLIRDDHKRTNDWPLSDHARLKLPSIHHSKFNYAPKTHFSIEI